MKLENVNPTYVQKAVNATTGIAQISVSEEGENQIIIIAGANTFLCASDVDKAEDLIKKADVLVLQLETSEEVAMRAIELSSGVYNFFHCDHLNILQKKICRYLF